MLFIFALWSLIRTKSCVCMLTISPKLWSIMYADMEYWKNLAKWRLWKARNEWIFDRLDIWEANSYFLFRVILRIRRCMVKKKSEQLLHQLNDMLCEVVGWNCCWITSWVCYGYCNRISPVRHLQTGRKLMLPFYLQIGEHRQRYVDIAMLGEVLPR